MSGTNHSHYHELSAYEKNVKSGIIIGYALMALGFFTGIFMIIGVIWAMLKKGEARDTHLQDHYSNIITVFWVGLFLSIIGYLTLFILIGILILICTYIWVLYRIIKGSLRIHSNQSYT